MIRVKGELLARAMEYGPDDAMLVMGMPELRAAPVANPRLPLVLTVPAPAPDPGQSWESLKQRMADHIATAADRLQTSAGMPDYEPLYAGASLATAMTTDELAAAEADREVVLDYANVDPLHTLVTDAESHADIGLAAFQSRFADSQLTGGGVSVAVLDSGIDAAHPALSVADAVGLCSEDVAIPGAHGTHCAGILASRDAAIPGIARDVSLIDVKVLTSLGRGNHKWIISGIDAALDRHVDILSISLGYNQLPATAGGHGWSCLDGRCPVCLAVESAVATGTTVVAAAGNDHASAQRLWETGGGSGYTTELNCPGQAAAVITVGAYNALSRAPAWFSSCGPAADGRAKPDLAAPGVNIMSTLPVPRAADGQPDSAAARTHLFGSKSGTSMATPLVAGACALLIEDARRRDAPAHPAAIRAALLHSYCTPMSWPGSVIGHGRLTLG